MSHIDSDHIEQVRTGKPFATHDEAEEHHPKELPRSGYLTKTRGGWPVRFYKEEESETLARMLLDEPRLQAWAVTIQVVDEVKAIPPTRPMLILAAAEIEGEED